MLSLGLSGWGTANTTGHILPAWALCGVLWPRLGRLELLFHATYLVLLPRMRTNDLDTPVQSPPHSCRPWILRGRVGRRMRNPGTRDPDLVTGAAERSRITEPSLLSQNTFQWVQPRL